VGAAKYGKRGLSVGDEQFGAALERFDDLAEELAGDGVSRGSMFGKPCLKAGSKAFACQFRDTVAFKLPNPEHANALAMAGAELFDPSGRGRPMKEWVQVPLAHADHWRALAEAAAAYVRP
jgi:hypothetical protein